MMQNVRNFISWKTVRWIVRYAPVVAIAALGVLFILPLVSPLRIYTVVSDSMAPTLSRGSVVFVLPQPHYTVGDIVTRSSGNPQHPVTHRVVDVQTLPDGTQRLRTRGDANATDDIGWISSSSVFGAVRFHLPWIGRIISYAQTPQGFVLLIVIPATLIIYHEVLSLVTHVQQRLRHRVDRNRR